MSSTTGTDRTTLNLTHRALAMGLDPRVAKSHGCSAPPSASLHRGARLKHSVLKRTGPGPMAEAAGSQDLEAGR
jgi:hypothetical protein